MTCFNCTRRTPLIRCSKCKHAYYCDATCQLNNWPVHKLCCYTAEEGVMKVFTAFPPGQSPLFTALLATIQSDAYKAIPIPSVLDWTVIMLEEAFVGSSADPWRITVSEDIVSIRRPRNAGRFEDSKLECMAKLRSLDYIPIAVWDREGTFKMYSVIRRTVPDLFLKTLPACVARNIHDILSYTLTFTKIAGKYLVSLVCTHKSESDDIPRSCIGNVLMCPVKQECVQWPHNWKDSDVCQF